ncbi:MAG: UDP-N-acetylmuramate--L-alanine ligase [Ruminococcaceae bacterium]|nr:UDP-N-acetylmuramate--L-alanine ligase [Oscillospiraceae bacterium]
MSQIESYIVPGKRCHLVGIGGISMRALGEVLHGMGLIVSGSDMQESDAVKQLRSMGINVVIGHLPESVIGADFVIRTAAVHDDNPEIASALSLGIPVFERAQSWGSLMKSYKNALCISGTHGKTTTTSMATHILMEAGRDPTVMIGGILPALGTSFRVGKSDTIVLESCEYCNSFLNFYPTIAVILNVEADHLDFFKDLDDIVDSFKKFTALTPASGTVVANADDAGAMLAAADTGRKLVTFGFSEDADVRGVNVADDSYSELDVEYNGQVYCHLSLNVFGRHNASNALAATAAAIVMGVSPEHISTGLAQFRGAGRRMEYKGEFNGAKIYDDYAHHPSEISATLTAVKALPHNRIICAFQPHTYSRTRALFDDFVTSLSLADITVLADIYAARESNTIGVSSAELAEHIPGCTYCGALNKVADHLKSIIQPGDIVLTVGAGNIDSVADMLLK